MQPEVDKLQQQIDRLRLHVDKRQKFVNDLRSDARIGQEIQDKYREGGSEVLKRVLNIMESQGV